MRILKVLVVITVMVMAFLALTQTVMATTENPLAIAPAAGMPQVVATAIPAGQIMASAITIIGQSQIMGELLLYERNEVVANNTASPPSLSSNSSSQSMATAMALAPYMELTAIPRLLVPHLRC